MVSNMAFPDAFYQLFGKRLWFVTSHNALYEITRDHFFLNAFAARPGACHVADASWRPSLVCRVKTQQNSSQSALRN